MDRTVSGHYQTCSRGKMYETLCHIVQYGRVKLQLN